ncbi:unnamed protein product [Cochlearia groenlandica]
MSNKSRTSIVFMILAMYIVLQVRPGLSQLIPRPNPRDFAKCWLSLFNVKGCVQEIYKSMIFSHKFNHVGTECCKAFSAIDTNCWPRMFPSNPFFPLLLKDKCASFAMAPSTSHM